MNKLKRQYVMPKKLDEETNKTGSSSTCGFCANCGDLVKRGGC